MIPPSQHNMKPESRATQAEHFEPPLVTVGAVGLAIEASVLFLSSSTVGTRSLDLDGIQPPLEALVTCGRWVAGLLPALHKRRMR
mmetsp:Transcript_14907/g.38642  ORF Transcript_14907/g.38642 Transcript_14907/m.38642 type:complete len:85 (+) Transcript_14907:55-309(+)